MAITKRIIARLDIKGPNLVKGIHLEGLRVLGKPEDFARYYYEQGAEELIYMDVVASLYERNSLEDIIRRTASEIFIPLTVGGGIRTIADIRKVLLAGADKVSLNTAVIRNPELIREASRYFGSSTIVVSIEAIKQPDGRYLAYIDNGREHTGVEVFAWAKMAEELGAGELVLTSVDREGTGLGYDLELIKGVTSCVSIPVVACGGAGKTGHVVSAIIDGGADAVAVASLFHYEYIMKHGSTGDFSLEGNTEFLKKNMVFSKITPASIAQVKENMKSFGLPTR
ncbi:MAG: imidazole glycerol phosphate synthase subunit HisF [Chlorobium sp.]|nr:imidazole glycerol phosphate synthase subunit HisF [Chlorobium sp.]